MQHNRLLTTIFDIDSQLLNSVRASSVRLTFGSHTFSLINFPLMSIPDSQVTRYMVNAAMWNMRAAFRIITYSWLNNNVDQFVPSLMQLL